MRAKPCDKAELFVTGRHVVVADDLRGDKLRGPAHGLGLLARLDQLGGPEVNNFDGGGVGSNTDHVLGLDS